MAKFRNQTETVDARRLEIAETVATVDGDVAAPAGHWLVTHADGSASVCDPDTFRILYSPVKRGRGRPSKYSQAVVDRICSRLIEGESLRRICSDPEMPSITTIWNWYRREDIKEDFLKQFLRARAFQSLVMDGDMQDIADDSSRDFTEGEDGEEAVDREHIQRSKLRVETLWRRMKCMNPEMFAEKLDLNHGGSVEMSLPELFAEAMKKRIGDGGDD